MNRYISQLLHYHDCVIVPGLGGFVLNYSEAKINTSLNLFSPPVKEVRFNRSLSHNDGLLANYIVQKEEVSYSEAVEKIDIYVDDIRLKITRGEEFVINEVGAFNGDTIGNIIFTPEESNSFLTDAFGLSSFRIEPVDNNQTVKLSKAQPVIARTKTINYWNSAAAVLVGAFFLLTTNLNDSDISQAGFIDFSSKSNVVLNEVVIKDVIKPASAKQSLPTEEYHIIAASLNSEASAMNMKNRFVKNGYIDTKILNDGKGHYRISIDSYGSREIAINRMKEYRKEKDFASVWVLKQ